MDAPTTMSANNGTSGGGSGWFNPRNQPPAVPGAGQGTAEGSRLAALHPVGRPWTSASTETATGA